MIIDKIILHNFGVYKDRHVIDLTPPSQDKPITLIGALNGGGKTTLLDAFQLALYGKLAACSNKKTTQAYHDYLRQCINKSVSPSDGAAVEIIFQQTIDGEKHDFHVKRSWYAAGISINENVQVQVDGELDKVISDGWYEYVEEFLPAKLSHLFFFDGEKIESLADLDNASQLLEKAIHSLLGIDTVSQLSKDLTILERKKRVEQKSEYDKFLINEVLATIQEYEKKHIVLDLKRKKFESEIKNLNETKKKFEENFRKIGGERLAERKSIEKRRHDIEQELAITNERAREIAAGSAPLLLVQDLLKNLVKQAAKEENAQKAHILNGILNERDMSIVQLLEGNSAPDKIMEKLNAFLEEDKEKRQKISEIEPYLHLSHETNQKINNLFKYELKNTKKFVQETIYAIELLSKELDDLDRELASVPDKDTVAEVINQLNENKATIKEVEREYESTLEALKSLSYNKEQLENRLEKLLRKKADYEGEQLDLERVITYSQKTRNTLETFRIKLVERHVDHIAQIILESFEQLSRKKGLITSIKISSKTFTLKLYGSDGKELPPDRLSAGERQLLATSMLWGLAKKSGRPLPTVIDTPLGRLDSTHRAHLLERYFPYASHQVLLLSTDEEITKPYLSKIKDYIGHSYLLEHNDENKSTHVKQGYFWS